MPHLMAVYELFTGRSPDRWWIEALILARESQGAIAEELGVPPEVVRAYAHVYFDLEGRITNAALVHQVGIGLAPGQPPGDPGQLWKLLGFLGGREIVRCLVGMKRLDLAGPGRADFERAILGQLRDEADIRALIATLVDGPSPTTVKALRLRSRAAALVGAARDRDREDQKAMEGLHLVLERARRRAASSECDGSPETVEASCTDHSPRSEKRDAS